MAIQHKLLLFPDFVSDNHMVLTKIKQSTKNGSNFGHISSIRGDGVGNCGAACSISCGASFNSSNFPKLFPKKRFETVNKEFAKKVKMIFTIAEILFHRKFAIFFSCDRFEFEHMKKSRTLPFCFVFGIWRQNE